MSVAEIQAENAQMRELIKRLERDIAVAGAPLVDRKWDLELDEYQRYGRQLILPEIGLDGASSR